MKASKKKNDKHSSDEEEPDDEDDGGDVKQQQPSTSDQGGQSSTSGQQQQQKEKEKKPTKDAQQEYIDSLREVFKPFSKDDMILSKDLGSVMRALAQNPSEAELKELVDEIGTETIDFDQFVTLMRKKAKKEDKVNEDELREGLKLFDVERTGVLTTQQLRFMISAYGEKWTEEEIEEMIRDADTDNDGMVNYEEFVKTIVQQ